MKMQTEARIDKIIYGNNLRTLRKSRGYTQEKVAKLVGIERANYAKIETGVSFGTVEIMVAFAELYNTSVEELLGVRTKSAFNFTVDKKLLKQFEKVCIDIGITTDTALNLFMQSVVRQNGLSIQINADEKVNTK